MSQSLALSRPVSLVNKDRHQKLYSLLSRLALRGTPSPLAAPYQFASPGYETDAAGTFTGTPAPACKPLSRAAAVELLEDMLHLNAARFGIDSVCLRPDGTSGHVLEARVYFHDTAVLTVSPEFIDRVAADENSAAVIARHLLRTAFMQLAALDAF